MHPGILPFRPCDPNQFDIETAPASARSPCQSSHNLPAAPSSRSILPASPVDNASARRRKLPYTPRSPQTAVSTHPTAEPQGKEESALTSPELRKESTPLSKYCAPRAHCKSSHAAPSPRESTPSRPLTKAPASLRANGERSAYSLLDTDQESTRRSRHHGRDRAVSESTQFPPGNRRAAPPLYLMNIQHEA